MTTSVLDLFSIGIGPSSSHTVGPMRAACHFVNSLPADDVSEVRVELYGSLALTGKGHGTDGAVLLGLSGYQPEQITSSQKHQTLANINSTKTIILGGKHTVPFTEQTIHFLMDQSLPEHANGLRFIAYSESTRIKETIYYSTGGGFVCLPGGEPLSSGEDVPVPYPFNTAEGLISLCQRQGMSIAELIWQNEVAMRESKEVQTRLLSIWSVMNESIERGLAREGVLPGGLNVHRRAPGLYQRLIAKQLPDDSAVLDWLSVYAMAVNEENAAGERVVTAPTNGAAGVIPAVLKYHLEHQPPADEQIIMDYLLTAGAIGILYKECASLSAAEVGCQGEVGVACSMAAGALTAIQGGTLQQIENAAEIGMEHNLGLTCDPVGGLVQIPCIERNTMGAVKAVNAAHLALNSDGRHLVSLDKVIQTMLRTGKDMQSQYKETSQGGLAIQVGMPEC